jgi:hypothetical protein
MSFFDIDKLPARCILHRHIVILVRLGRVGLIVLVSTKQAVAVGKFVIDSDRPEVFGGQMICVEGINPLVSVAHRPRVGQLPESQKGQYGFVDPGNRIRVADIRFVSR